MCLVLNVTVARTPIDLTPWHWSVNVLSNGNYSTYEAAGMSVKWSGRRMDGTWRFYGQVPYDLHTVFSTVTVQAPSRRISRTLRTVALL